MSFYTTDLIYNGTPASMFGLMISEFNMSSRDANSIGGTAEIHSDKLPTRHDSLLYYVSENEPLSFNVSLVAMEDNHRFDRYEIAQIAGWLRSAQSYCTLVAFQPDMENVVYKALVTNVTPILVGAATVGFVVSFECDSPYAYRYAPDTILTCQGSTVALYRNESNVRGYYYPQCLTIDAQSTDIVITNVTDNSQFVLSGITAGQTITIDCLNQVMLGTADTNLYQYWNVGIPKQFPRFVRGINQLSIEGDCTIRIQNTFLWNVGA